MNKWHEDEGGIESEKGKRNRSSLYKMNVTVGRAFIIQARKQINPIYRQKHSCPLEYVLFYNYRCLYKW